MRGLFMLLAGALVSNQLAVAQQSFGYEPGRSHFASRGNLGTGAGETLQGFHSNANRGLGDVGTHCEVHGLTAFVQDENGATQEEFGWVIRHGSDATGPTRSAADLVLQLNGLKTPPATAGKTSFQLSLSLATPVRLRDCKTHFSVGLALNSNANWPSDGLSSHAAHSAIQTSHARQEDHAWEFPGSASTATHPGNKRTYRYALLLPGAVMQLGNGGKLYGMGGMFPKEGSPLSAQVSGGTAMANSPGIVVMSTKQFRLDGTIRIGPGAGLYLSPSYHLFLFTTDATGGATKQILPSVPANFAQAGTFHFQSIIDKNGVGALFLSNCHTVIP